MTSRYSKLYKPKGAPPSQRSNVITTIKQDMSLQIVWHSILGGGSKLKVSLSLEVVKVAPGGLLSLSLPPRLASTHWRCLSLGEVMRLRAVKLYWWSYWMLWLQRYSCRDSAVKKICDHILCWFWLSMFIARSRLLILYHTEVTINLQDKYLIWFTLLTTEPRLLHWSHWSRRYLKYSKRTWV